MVKNSTGYLFLFLTYKWNCISVFWSKMKLNILNLCDVTKITRANPFGSIIVFNSLNGNLMIIWDTVYCKHFFFGVNGTRGKLIIYLKKRGFIVWGAGLCSVNFSSVSNRFCSLLCARGRFDGGVKGIVEGFNNIIWCNPLRTMTIHSNE